MKQLLTILCLCAFLAGAMAVAPADAGVLRGRDEALKLAFASDEHRSLNLFLTEAELQRVEALCGVRPESALYTFYVSSNSGTVSGYASIEAAVVRTQPATVLVVLEPDARLRLVEVLAFFEPQEYLPSRRWLDQFGGKTLGPDLRVDGDIHGISGATLSAQSLTRQARKTAAILKVYLERAK